MTATLAHLLTVEVKPDSAPEDVGDGIKAATIRDPFGNLIGLIENPHFKFTDVPE